ncbi:unnamed protein product, partial [Rotaria sordida]
DTGCYIRVFRENIDNKHTWINLAKNQNELENLIKLLITDHVVRKKFPEWKFSYESFNCLSSSNEFEERYSLNLSDNKNKNELLDVLCSSVVIFNSDFIKTEDVDFDPVVNLNRDLPSSPPISSSFEIDNIERKNELDKTSDSESINSIEIIANRLSISSSNDTRDEIYSCDYSQDSYNNYNYKYEDIENTIKKIQHITSTNDNHDVQVIIKKPLLDKGIKRKLVDYDDSESDLEDNEKHDETSQDSHHIPVNKESINNTELPIALRRSKRGHRPFTADLSPTSSSTSKSASRSSGRKKSVNERWKNSSQPSKTNGRRRRRGRTSTNEHSSSTSDEHQLYNDDDLSDDYLPDKTEIDELLNGNLLDEEEDDDDSISHRTAKTVAQCHEQFQRPLTACSICLQINHPESLLLCEDCDDAYHLECLKPELLSIPIDSWYCPLCEHKRLCDGLIEKLLILIKDQREFEMKRRLHVSKRRKRLTNVAVNLERYVKQSTNEIKTNGIMSSDETEENEKKTDSTNNNNNNNNNNDDDDDDDSVYGRKNDENRKPSDQESEQPGKRRVRSCRRKAQNYSFDDYDKKIKEAMIDAGINKELIEIDSDDSDEVILKRKQSKKRRRYEYDDDFDASDSKTNEEYLPSRRRVTNDNSRSTIRDYDAFLSNRRPTINDDSRSNARDYDDFLPNRRPTINDDSRSARDYDDFLPNRRSTINDDSRSDARDYDDNDDFGMSDDDSAWRNRQQPSASSKPKKKSIAKSNRNSRRKSTIRTDEDSILSETNLNNLSSGIKIKTEPTTEFDKNINGTNETAKNVFDKHPVVNNSLNKNPVINTSLGKTPNVENVTNQNEVAKTPKPRRPRRAAATKKKPLIQQEKFTDEEDNGHPPLPARRPYRRRRVSHESSPDDDDDYEKLAHKRRLFSQGKGTIRTSITAHIKKLVGDEDEDEDEEQEEIEEDATKDKSSDGKKKDGNNNSKPKNKNLQHDEYQLSDDDDFPDEQEILKTTGLNLKKPLNIPKVAPIRAPVMSSMQSYQFTMADPTANFDLTCLPETPITEPSDSNQANANHNLSTTI